MTSKKPAAPATFYKGEDYDVRDSVGYLLHAVTVSMLREIESRLAQHGMTRLNGGKVEGAWMSGRELAQRVLHWLAAR